MVAAYQAALAVATETNRDDVLLRIVTLAREVVPCRYAALGVADEHGYLKQFITIGIPDEEVARIGPYPVGKGLLGALIRDGQRLIVDSIADDPRSVGFPPNHPPMTTLLGAPIKLGDRTLGNIYLTERIGADRFSEADFQTLEILAANAAHAIERADLYQQIATGAALAERERDQLTTIIATLPNAVLIVDHGTGRIELGNRQAELLLAGDRRVAMEELVPGTDFTIVRDDGLPFPVFTPTTVVSSSSIPTHALQGAVHRSDGSRVPVLIQAARLPEGPGDRERSVLVLQDISRLRDAEQLKDDFLALISHEFRTPLTSIHGGAYLLKQQGDALDKETREELLTDIVNESGRLDRMLVNMLSLAAAMAGRITIRAEPVMVGPIVKRVAAETGRRVRSIGFSVELPAKLPLVECDPEALEQVLRNLYENAIKYGPERGVIRTVASVQGETLVLSVIDQGGGIAAEHVAHVFERFRRPGADLTIRGMGLGLYLSRLLIESQGGTISAASDGPGKGATFSISLPIVESE